MEEVSFDATSWAGTLATAFELISSDASSLEITQTFAKRLCPLEPHPTGMHLSVSHSSCIGAVFLSFDQDPITIGEAIVHEADHNFLFELENQSNLWVDIEFALQPIHWSPWRADARPLNGLLLGASAFVRAAEFLSSAANHVSQSDRAQQIIELAVLRCEQSRCALDYIGSIARHMLSDTGRSLLCDLDNRLSALQNEHQKADRYGDHLTAAKRNLIESHALWIEKHQ